VTFTVIQPLTIVGTSDAVSSITTLSNGDYLITYTPFNNDPAIQDEIVAREFDPTGQIVSTAILTQFHGFDTSTPYASGLAGGGYAIAWDDNSFPNNNVGMQVFAVDGTPISSRESLGPTFTSNLTPSVTPLANGGYVLTWSSTKQIVTETFDAQGNPISPLTQVSTSPDGASQFAAHAASPNGGYALAFEQTDPQSTRSDVQIFFASFDAQGNEIGAPVDVSQSITSELGFFRVQLAALTKGDYALVWVSGNDAATDSFQPKLWTAIYDGNGNQLVAPESLGQVVGGAPAITALADGHYAVVWTGASGDVFTEVLNAQGQALSTPLDVGPAVTFASPYAATLSNGDYALLWYNGEGGGVMTAVCDPQGQEVAGPVLVDDDPFSFLSGDTPQITALANGAYAVTWENGDPALTSQFDQIRSATFQFSVPQPPSLDVIQGPTEVSSIGAFFPVIGALANGDYAIAYDFTTTDFNIQDEIVARVFDPSGQPVGGSTLTQQFGFDQPYLSVTGLSGGGFALAWDSNDITDLFQSGIGTATFSSDGSQLSAPLGLAFVNPPNELEPTVTLLADGGYAVSWTTYLTSNNSQVVTQTFGANATGPTQISAAPATGATGGIIAHAASPGGGYALAWSQVADVFGPGDDSQIYFASFDPQGSEIGAPIDISQSITSDMDFFTPQMTALSNGDYALVWHSTTDATFDTFLQREWTAIYDGNGNQIVAPELVGQIIGMPVITSLAGSDYAVAWQGDGGDVYTAVYGPHGQQVSAPLDISHASGTQPQLVTLSNGDYAVAWVNDTSGISTAVFSSQGEQIIAPAVVSGAINGQDSFTSREPALTALANGEYVVTWLSPNANYPTDPNPNELWSSIYRVSDNSNAPPSPPLITGFTPDTGIAGDRITEAQSLVVSGTSEPGIVQVKVSDGAGLTRTVTPDSAGNWSVPFSNLALGTYDFTAIAVNDLGNASAASAAFEIDVVPPPAPIITGFTPDTGVAGDHITEAQSLVVSGTSEPGIAQVKVSDGAGLTRVVTPDAAGNWSVPFSNLALGTYDFTAIAVNGLGNASAASAPFEIKIEINAPPVISSGASVVAALGLASQIKNFLPGQNGISISDADAGSANETIRVELKEHDGVATLSANKIVAGGGGMIDGGGTNDLVITGTLAQVNADLSTVTVSGSQSDHTDAIDIQASDGRGGTDASELGLVIDAPALATVPGTQSVQLGAPLSIPIAISDADANPTAIYIVALRDTNGAAFSITGGPQTTTFNFNGSFEVLAPLAELNNDLATLQYQSGTSGRDTISVAPVDDFQLGFVQQFVVDVNAPLSISPKSLPGFPLTTLPIYQVGVATPMSGFALVDRPIAVISDADGASETIRVELKERDSAAVFSFDTNPAVAPLFGGLPAGAITGQGTNDLVITGNLDTVNLDLAAVTILASRSDSGDLIDIQASDGRGSADATEFSATIDAPAVTSVPGDQVAQIGLTLPIPKISVSDVDADTLLHNETYSVELKDTLGFLAITGGSHTAILFNGSHDVTITAPLDELNTDLASLLYLANSPGSDTITIQTKDGIGYGDMQQIAVSVNVPPVITGVEDFATMELGEIAFIKGLFGNGGISLSDADSAGETFRVELKELDGAATLFADTNSGGGGTIQGSGTSDLVITGSLAEVNGDLSSVVISGIQSDRGDQILIDVSDGRGGFDSSGFDLQIDAPAVATVPGNQIAQLGATLSIHGIGVSDADADTTPYRVELSDQVGSLTVTGGLHTFISGNGTRDVTITAPLGELNTDLASVGYLTSTLASDTITVHAQDNFGFGSSGQIAVAINAPPVINGVEDFATIELGAVAVIKGLFGNGGISVSDADSAGETFRVELKELDGAATLFADTNSGGGGTIQGSGTSDLVITGSLAEVNGDLSSVRVRATRSDGGDQILIDVNDGRGGAATSVFDLEIDAPALTTVPGDQIAQLGATLSIHGISVSDIDADTAPYRVELSDNVGSLTVTGGPHTFISGNGTHDLIINAPLGELNTDLASLGYLTSTLASDTITVHAQDNFGFGSSGQIAVTINAPPHATAPSNATVTQSVRTAIAGIGVTDSDGSQENFSVTLAASNGGILSATTSGGGGKISGAGTSHLTISGTLGQVDADLATLTYFNTRSGSGTIDMLTNDGRGGSDDHQIAVTINPPIQLPPPPKLIKGYISGATVFADDNGNGQLDPNEFTATTDANGGFALAGGSGPLIAFGGVDISTGLPFLGEFTAPADSIVVTPLTTLLNLLEQQGVGDAEARLLGALNLAPGLDLFTLDPIAAAQGGDLTGAAAEVAAAKVYDTVALIAATLSGIGATFKTAVNDSFAAIAAAIAGAGINLADPAALTALIDGVAQSEGLTLPLGLANEVATILAASNAALDHVELADQTGASLLADTAAIEKDVQGGASQAFGAAGGDPTKVAAFAFNFTGADGESFDATAGTPALVLSGTSGNDVLTGSAVISNIIDGKAGNDTMSGGLKDDTFVFEFGVSQHTVNDTVHHHDFVSLAGVTSVTVGGATYNKPALNASINAWKTWDSALTAYANGQRDNTGGDDFTAFTNTNPANPKNVGTIQLIDGYFHNYDTVQPVIVTDLSGSGFDVITNFGNQALTVVSAIGNDTLQFNGLSNDQTALNYWGNWLTSTTRNGTTTIDFHDVAHNVADVAAISLIGVTTNVSTLVADNIVRFGSPSA